MEHALTVCFSERERTGGGENPEGLELRVQDCRAWHVLAVCLFERGMGGGGGRGKGESRKAWGMAHPNGVFIQKGMGERT